MFPLILTLSINNIFMKTIGHGMKLTIYLICVDDLTFDLSLFMIDGTEKSIPTEV